MLRSRCLLMTSNLIKIKALCWSCQVTRALFHIDNPLLPVWTLYWDFLLFAQPCLSGLFFIELRKLALVLVDGWMAIIRSQSVSSGASPNGNTFFTFLHLILIGISSPSSVSLCLVLFHSFCHNPFRIWVHVLLYGSSLFIHALNDFQTRNERRKTLKYVLR